MERRSLLTRRAARRPGSRAHPPWPAGRRAGTGRGQGLRVSAHRKQTSDEGEGGGGIAGGSWWWHFHVVRLLLPPSPLGPWPALLTVPLLQARRRAARAAGPALGRLGARLGGLLGGRLGRLGGGLAEQGVHLEGGHFQAACGAKGRGAARPVSGVGWNGGGWKSGRRAAAGGQALYGMHGAPGARELLGEGQG